MKQISKTLFVLFLLCAPLHAGNLNLEYQSGIGTYAMSDFRWINYQIIHDSPIVLKKMSNFDPYIFWRPLISYTFGKNELGFSYTLQSTGSRAGAEDYSGSYYYDMRIKASGFGLTYSLYLDDLGPFQSWLYSNSGINSSHFLLHETFNLLEADLIDHQVNLKGVHAYFEAGFRFVYPMKPFSLTLNMGYQYQPPDGQKLYEENKDEPFEAMDSKYLYPDWSGLRISVGFSKSLHFLHL